MTDFDHEPRHVFRPASLFERRGDRLVMRGIGEDRPYERIFRLKLWLLLSVLLNAGLTLLVWWTRW